MRLVDTHCHLQSDAFSDDRESVLEAALDEIDWLVVVGDELGSSARAVELVRERVWATVGIHPHHASSASAESINQLEELAQEPGVVAIGEVGLDYYYNHSPRPRQQETLAAQLELAAKLNLPVVVHNRDAHEDLIPILDGFATRLAGGIMHCFQGDARFVRRCLDWGFFISFAGNVTFRKAEELRDAAKAVPMDRLLVETDSPYLAPVPVRGKRCEPRFVQHTAAFLAELKGVPLEDFAAQTTENAANAFCLAAHSGED